MSEHRCGNADCGCGNETAVAFASAVDRLMFAAMGAGFTIETAGRTVALAMLVAAMEHPEWARGVRLQMRRPRREAYADELSERVREFVAQVPVEVRDGREA